MSYSYLTVYAVKMIQPKLLVHNNFDESNPSNQYLDEFGNCSKGDHNPRLKI